MNEKREQGEGTAEHRVIVWTPRSVTTRTVDLPPEHSLCIQVNGQELVRVAASLSQREALVVGFLSNAGLIRGPEEIRVLHFSVQRTCADVWLDHDLAPAQPLLLTSGCGRGIVLGEFSRPAEPLDPALRVAPAALAAMMREMQDAAELYPKSGGVHVSALFSPAGTRLALAEDIGRHNTLDKLLGLCLLEGLSCDSPLLLTTGRISSEMVGKAARLRAPVVASMTAVSSAAVALAETWGMTTVGYLRGLRMRIYTHPQRVGL